MQDILDAAEPSSYGLFDKHYLQASILVKKRAYAKALAELANIYSIQIANQSELKEHISIADFLSLLLKQRLGEEVPESRVIEAFLASPTSNTRFLNGFVNGGYLGIDFLFPQFGQIISSTGTSFLEATHTPSLFKDELIHTISLRKPFSFIRCNDGEGCLLYFLDAWNEDQRSLPFEHFYALWDLWRGWFGVDLLSAKSAVMQTLKDEFRDLIVSSTFVGVDLSVVKTWHISIGLESKLGCYYSALKCKDLRHDSSVVSSSVFYDLQEDDGFAMSLFRSYEWSIITCHRQSAELLRARGIGVLSSIIVPAEQRFNDLFGTPSESGVHLDQVFVDICRQVDEVDAAVNYFWLVSAGPLGKIYANKLMKRGCFVLDIGAIMDGLLGYARRDRLKSFA